MKNIKNVLANDACTGCGCCSNVCSRRCIETKLDYRTGCYKTSLDANNCVDCGLCRKVCPVYTWNNKDGNPYVGGYRKVYSGYSLNDTHRIDSASGGITTSILAYLLEKDMVDAAAVAVRDSRNALESEMIIVTSPLEACGTRGSVYAPTSYNDIIGRIKQSNYERWVVVGLPCHIEGISRLCELDKKLKGRIRYKIALVCGHTPSLGAYLYSLKHLRIDPGKVKSLRNRGDGWPGYMSIQCFDDKRIRIGHGTKYSWGQTLGSPLFTPPGCKHCSDPTGYLADVSISDAWLPRYKDDQKGRNLILVRMPEMENLLEAMTKDSVIELTEEHIDDFIKANRSVFKEKLHVNAFRNSRLQKQEGLYPDMDFLPAGSVKASFFIRLLLAAEKFFGMLPKNDATLFLLKVVKYLSQRWIVIRKY